jgi:hypothetical protein
MLSSEAILLVIVIIVIIYVYRKKKGDADADESWTCYNNNDARVVQVDIAKTKSDMETDMHKEHFQYYNNQTNDPNGNVDNAVLECSANGGQYSGLDFNKYPYGGKDMGYADFVASQALDVQTVKNHNDYIKDRAALASKGTLFTGRTYTPDSHDSYDPIPWIGLRRPEAYPGMVKDPTQLTDIDERLYIKNRRFYI